MFTIKNLNDEKQLAQCESRTEVLEKAEALWISTGGRIKIVDNASKEFSLDEFKAAITRNPPSFSSATAEDSRGHHGEPQQDPNKPDVDLPGG